MKKLVSLLILLTSVMALGLCAVAQQQDNHPTNNALARLLESKGILSASELATDRRTTGRRSEWS